MTHPRSGSREHPETTPGLPPTAKKAPWERTFHGYSWVDNYDWLRKIEDSDAMAYLEAENTYTELRTAHLAELRENIFQEIKSRTQETDLAVPVRRGHYWYYARSFANREYGASCRAAVTSLDHWHPPVVTDLSADQPALPNEEVMLDLDQLASDHNFFALGGSSISPQENLLLYGLDTVGNERYTLQIKNLDTETLLPDQIVGTRGSGVWDASGTSFYYTSVDDAFRSDRVWQHVLGTDQAEDQLVFHETDERFFVGVGKSRSERFVMVASGSKLTSDYQIFDFQQPELGWWRLCDRQEGLEYHLEHAVIDGRDVFLILHNLRHPDFEISVASIAPTQPTDWEEFLPATPGVRFEGVDAFESHLVVSQRSLGLTQLRVLQPSHHPGREDFLIEFPSSVFTVGLGANPNFNQPTIRLGYTSMTTPSSIYEYEVATRRLQLLKQTPVLGEFRSEDYTELRLWATAADGAQVPISFVARTEFLTDQPIPIHLYGYGSYEISVDPYFSIARLSVLDRGIGFAIAHVRGGGEMGRSWYDNGKLRHKQNTFSDFIACAEHLVESGRTSFGQIVAEGGSAGGLLMGAVANQAPSIFGGVVADVPFVDCLTTMLDPTLPLTVTEYDEWGNPTDDPEAFATIHRYAPYHNVAKTSYPPMLALTSLEDTRVLYVEPAKWVAQIREQNDGAAQVLLKTEMTAGHGGVSGRYQTWRDRAFTLAWIIDQVT
jgi:oligopeptidase B